MLNEQYLLDKIHTISSMCQQPLANSGRGVDQVAERQRRRKIVQLRNECKRALWFADSFNVDIIKIVARTKTTNEEISLPMSSPPFDIPTSSQPSHDSEQLHQMLYLLDRFAVSDEFYHQLSMVNRSLPKSYKIKEARQRINSNIELKRLPKPYSGCYRSFKRCLEEAIITEVRIIFCGWKSIIIDVHVLFHTG